jgi:hypothetical protein
MEATMEDDWITIQRVVATQSVTLTAQDLADLPNEYRTIDDLLLERLGDRQKLQGLEAHRVVEWSIVSTDADAQTLTIQLVVDYQ